MNHDIHEIYSERLNTLYVDSSWLAKAKNVTELLTGAFIYTAAAIAAKDVGTRGHAFFDLHLDRQDLLRLCGRSLKSHTLAPYFKAPVANYGVTCKGSRNGTTISGNALSVLAKSGNLTEGIDPSRDIRITRDILHKAPGRPGILYSFIRSRAFSRTKDRRVKSQSYILDAMPGIVSRNTFPAAIAKLKEMNVVKVGRCIFNGIQIDTFTPLCQNPQPNTPAIGKRRYKSQSKSVETATEAAPQSAESGSAVDYNSWN